MVAGKRLAFWGAVAATSVLAQLAVRVGADRFNVPGLKTLDAYLTRSNG
jgi:hypothetical protein